MNEKFDILPTEVCIPSSLGIDATRWCYNNIGQGGYFHNWWYIENNFINTLYFYFEEEYNATLFALRFLS